MRRLSLLSPAHSVPCSPSVRAPRPAQSSARPNRHNPSSGSITSPVPLSTNVAVVSQTISSASRWRSIRPSASPWQLHRRPSQVARVLLQLGFEAPEERERVRGRIPQSPPALVLIQPPDLLRRVASITLAPQRHLPSAAITTESPRRTAQHRRRATRRACPLRRGPNPADERPSQPSCSSSSYSQCRQKSLS